MRPLWPLLLLGACGQAPEATFIAFERDFADFEQWPSVEISNTILFNFEDEDGDQQNHTLGSRHVYAKIVADDGGEKWSVGTTFVEESKDGILASVKRGHDYNVKGATGWEWFGLARTSTGIRIRWRGLGSPSGEEYSHVNGTCNACHGASKPLDGVLTPGFRRDH